MNIKHIIRKVLNENTNPIIKLLNKRGIDPIKDVINTIDFLENTLDLDDDEIIDTYKSILGNNITEDTYFTIFENIIKSKGMYTEIQRYYDQDDKNLCDIIVFIRGDEEVMVLYPPGYFTNVELGGKKLNDSSPLLIIDNDYTYTLKKLFDKTWKEPFKKWIYNKFGEIVKTVK